MKCYRERKEKTTCGSPGPRETTLGTGVGNTRGGILHGGACDGCSRRVHEGQSSAHQGRTAPSNGELPTNTLSKSSRDTGVLTICVEIDKLVIFSDREAP